jgi:hypothetical protein
VETNPREAANCISWHWKAKLGSTVGRSERTNLWNRRQDEMQTKSETAENELDGVGKGLLVTVNEIGEHDCG